MVCGRGILAWALVAICGFAAGILFFRLADDDGGSDAARRVGAPGRPALEVQPSAFARQTLPPRVLSLYLRTGRDLGLDWSVVAAVDQVEGAGGPASDDERVAAIGYSLEAFGAPQDYRQALESRPATGGDVGSVLRLAERYRTIAGAEEVPRAEGRLSLPAAGPMVAGFGQRLGVLHDGIDVDAPTGRPVRASAAGLVVSTGTHPVFGQQTCVLHRYRPPLLGERELTTCYGNQSAYEVTPGDAVDAGEVIGRVGCTGSCLRPHVHFQVRLGAGPTAPVADPAPYLARRIGRARRGAPLETPTP